MRLALATVLAVAACSDPPAMPDAGADAQEIDAIPIDSDPNAPDATDAPPSACPEADPPATIPGAPPTGAWDGRWTCVSDCTRPVASPLFTATSVVAGATVAWHTPTGAIQHPATAVRGCWVVAATDCASGYALCSTPGASATQVQFASVFELDVGRWQMWEWRGHVP